MDGGAPGRNTSGGALLGQEKSKKRKRGWETLRCIYSITPEGRRFFEHIKKNRIKGQLKEFIRDLAR